jgi:hypothetical protein
MTHLDTKHLALRVRTACPKSWSELAGSGATRFCSECSLHVHGAAQLTRAQAERLVAEASGRVCMRLQIDPAGAPLYRDAAAAQPRVLDRAMRWALAAAAGLLAACHGGDQGDPPDGEPLNAGSAQCTELMGRIAVTEKLGDVALPDAREPEVPDRIETEPPPPEKE